MKGFTLIELIIVFSVLITLSTVGLASFGNYSNSQILQSGASEVASLLHAAKEDAIAQIKPSSCASQLQGYKVSVTTSGTSYRLIVVCGANYVINQKNLPSHLEFSPGSSPEIFFNVQDGTAAVGRFIVSGPSGSKTLSVDAVGNIVIQ